MAPYLGTWRIVLTEVENLGQPTGEPQESYITIAATDDQENCLELHGWRYSVPASAQLPSDPMSVATDTTRIHLQRIGDKVIAIAISEDAEPGSTEETRDCNIAWVRFRDEGHDHIELVYMSDGFVGVQISTGHLEGSMIDWGHWGSFPVVTASAERLRAFLDENIDHPELFPLPLEEGEMRIMLERVR